MKRGLATSLAIHALVGAALLLFPARASRSDRDDPLEIVFYKKKAPVAPAPIAPVAKREIKPPAKPREPRKEPAPPPVVQARPPVAPPPPLAPPQAPRRAPEPAVAKAAPPPPAPPARTVRRVNAFGSPTTTLTASHTRTDPRRDVVVNTAFADTPAPTTPRTEPSKRDVVRGAAFDSEDPPAPATHRDGRERGAVATTGFSVETVAAPAGGPTSGTVQRGGFGDTVRETAVARPRELPAKNPEAAVEIISKPTPVYTATAREMRIEGEVVLEVTFVASGELRVLRVLEGLGHGLDEAAVAAAEQIRFKPARRDGHPVDHTATLRVVFRLA